MTISITNGDTPNFAGMDRMQLEKIAQQATTLARRIGDNMTLSQSEICYTQWRALTDTLNTEPIQSGNPA